ncbi:MAG: mandelate racemase/muconate lactonizing enzyme family protein, partial [Rhodospirillales bacterium]|nr:mandelate racemase/muconate lactonizing enzyme family protein [Rhodospirillales bacterium]
TQIAPAVLGADVRDIAGLRSRLNRMLHLFGRNGVHLYGLSALDIALWDMAGQAAGMPIWRLLGGTPAASLRAYASLLRYGDPKLVAEACARAVAAGYRDIKLHEIELPMILAAREAIGPEVRLMVDCNCPWSKEQAVSMARALRDTNLTWLEEPLWPPEDHVALAEVRALGGAPIAAGENAGGLHDFLSQFRAGALDIAQPSVIKIGGISAMSEIAALARAFAVRLVPHNAYFGPGYLASLNTNTALAPDAPFERLFIDLEASPYGDLLTAPQARAAVPDGPGLGRAPDMDVLRRYAIDAPTIAKT